MFKTVLTDFINSQHELCLLAKEIDWDYLEKVIEHCKRIAQRRLHRRASKIYRDPGTQLIPIPKSYM